MKRYGPRDRGNWQMEDAIVKQTICKTSEAPSDGEAQAFPFFGHDEQVWRRGDLSHATANVCLHLGEPMECQDGTFVGPWHGARFDMTDGCHLDSPAPANTRLRVLPTRIEAERQMITREEERERLIGQLNRAVELLSRQHKATRQANEFKSELLGMVAHELRSPLAAIVGHADLIETLLDLRDKDATAASSGPLHGKIRKSCGKIAQISERMETMIGEMLQSARRDATSIRLNCCDTELAAAVSTAIYLNKSAARKKRIRIDCELVEGTHIVADEDRLVKIFDNLVNNAVKYSSKDSVVTVKMRVDDAARMAVVTVADQGQGMSEYDLAEAFRRFHRLSAKPTGGESSTGLGLAIVRAIAEAHGGTADVYSPGKLLGCTFTVCLPLDGPQSNRRRGRNWKVQSPIGQRDHGL